MAHNKDKMTRVNTGRREVHIERKRETDLSGRGIAVERDKEKEKGKRLRGREYGARKALTLLAIAAGRLFIPKTQMKIGVVLTASRPPKIA